MEKMQELKKIAEKKQHYWKKVDQIRKVLIDEHKMDYDDATEKAHDMVKEAESGRIGQDNEYMRQHFESMQVKPVDSEMDFWNKMGITDEENIPILSNRLKG